MRHIKSTRTAICGYCLEPASKHGFIEAKDRIGTFIVAEYGPSEFDRVYCSRLPEEIGYLDYHNEETGQIVADFWIVDDNNVVIIPDTSGPSAGRTDEDPYEYVSPDIEESILDRWHDTATTTYDNQTAWICTPTLEQHQHPAMTTTNATEVIVYKQSNMKDDLPSKDYVARPYSRNNTLSDQQSKKTNEYVENFEGFLGEKLLDEFLTEKHHRHLLNVFQDSKTGDLRVGSIRLTSNVDGTLTSSCVQNSCSGRLTFDPSSKTREEMEQIVWAIVSHGNNHKARWLKTREVEDKHVIHFTLDGKDYSFNQKEPSTHIEHYTLHHPGCPVDGTCLIRGHCSYRGTAPQLADEDEQYRFLFEHQRYCKDMTCKCEQRMAELRPDLHPELALLMELVALERAAQEARDRAKQLV